MRLPSMLPQQLYETSRAPARLPSGFSDVQLCSSPYRSSTSSAAPFAQTWRAASSSPSFAFGGHQQHAVSASPQPLSKLGAPPMVCYSPKEGEKALQEPLGDVLKRAGKR